jgi:anti-anti-sigma regulatory factor
MRINGLIAGELEVQVKQRGSSIVLNFLGRSVDRNPGTELRPYFEGIREALAGRSLVLDFRELKYMNSSTVRPIIEIIQGASKIATAVEVHYHSSVTWQRLSFKLIEALAKEWPNVTIQG